MLAMYLLMAAMAADPNSCDYWLEKLTLLTHLEARKIIILNDLGTDAHYSTIESGLDYIEQRIRELQDQINKESQ